MWFHAYSFCNYIYYHEIWLLATLKFNLKISQQNPFISTLNFLTNNTSYSMALKPKLDFWKKIGLVLIFNPCWNRNLGLVLVTKYVKIKRGGGFWAAFSQFQNCGRILDRVHTPWSRTNSFYSTIQVLGSRTHNSYLVIQVPTQHWKMLSIHISFQTTWKVTPT
jgi:hypothetical protein